MLPADESPRGDMAIRMIKQAGYALLAAGLVVVAAPGAAWADDGLPDPRIMDILDEVLAESAPIPPPAPAPAPDLPPPPPPA